MENKTKIIKFIDDKCLGGVTSMVFDNDAINLLIYICRITFNKHLELANIMRQYAKKSSIDFKSIKYSNLHLLNGDIGKKCQIKLDEISNILLGKQKCETDSEEPNKVDDNLKHDSEESGEEIEENDSSDDSD